MQNKDKIQKTSKAKKPKNKKSSRNNKIKTPSTPLSVSAEVAADSPAYQAPAINLNSRNHMKNIKSTDSNPFSSDSSRSELNSGDYIDYDNDNANYDSEEDDDDEEDDYEAKFAKKSKSKANFPRKIDHFDFPTNLDGNAATKALLPGPPRDLVAQIVNPRFVTLSWLEPTINPDEVVNYSVYYKMNTSDR